MVDQRTVGRPAKIVPRPAPGAAPGPAPEAYPAAEAVPARRRGLRLALIVAVVALAAAGAAYLLGPWGAPAQEPAEPVPGAVVTVEPSSLNLADGHYLRLGFAMQLSADAPSELETARARDAAIAIFSGLDVGEATDPARRGELKAELLQRLNEAYGGTVIEVLLTDYVTQ